jgi:hypothetical protein
LIFCEKCGKKARDTAIFCSGCGLQIQVAENTSSVVSTKSRSNSRKRIVLSIGSAVLIGSLAFATLNIQNIASTLDNLVNPVPEKVFVTLSNQNKNQGWSQDVTFEVKVEANKENSYLAILELKSGSNWKKLRQSNLLSSKEDMASTFKYSNVGLEPGPKEVRVRVQRKEGAQELVEVSKSIKFKILKQPENMYIAEDSNNTIVWRFAKENEEPQYCAKYSRCYFLKIASTKRCQIRATLLLKGKEATINSAKGSSIGSVAAYTPGKPYLIEVPYNAAITGWVSARCFALSSSSNQVSTPTPTPTQTKKFQVLNDSALCSDGELERYKSILGSRRPEDWPSWAPDYTADTSSESLDTYDQWLRSEIKRREQYSSGC